MGQTHSGHDQGNIASVVPIINGDKRAFHSRRTLTPEAHIAIKEVRDLPWSPLDRELAQKRLCQPRRRACPETCLFRPLAAGSAGSMPRCGDHCSVCHLFLSPYSAGRHLQSPFSGEKGRPRSTKWPSVSAATQRALLVLLGVPLPTVTAQLLLIAPVGPELLGPKC